MIKATKLMRGVFLALAMMSGAAISGGTLVGVQPAQAQQAGESLISAVLFEGNRGFSDNQLLAMVNVAERGTVTDARLAADVESIRLAYEAKGYANVQVSARQEATQSGRLRIVFVIQENERTGIAAINFTGNNSIDAGTLK